MAIKIEKFVQNSHINKSKNPIIIPDKDDSNI